MYKLILTKEEKDLLISALMEYKKSDKKKVDNLISYISEEVDLQDRKLKGL